MERRRADVVVCGAGIAGIAAAYHLAVGQGIRDVVLVDERAPLSLTSDKSTEAYRNWWPGPDAAMIRLMTRSIDLLEALADSSEDAFTLNRRGYVYATADPGRATQLAAAAETAAQQGAGPLRRHPSLAGERESASSRASAYVPHAAHGYRGQPAGADLLTGPLVHRHFPYLAPDTVAALHVRRCGWFSAHGLGMQLLEGARARGTRRVEARVEAIERAGDRVTGVRVAGPGGASRIETRIVVDAAGPFVGDLAGLLDVTLPVFSERHVKFAFDDDRGVVPRDAPLLIWDDAQALVWTDEERAVLVADPALGWLTAPLPAGAHLRPEGRSPDSRTLLLLWAYHGAPTTPVFPFPPDPHFPELVMRGVARMIPGLEAYAERLPRGVVDGGYYTRTPENRPLVGPLPVEGAYVLGALSGFGLMAACAAGELLAAHVTGGTLPDYAPAFLLSRYDDPAYHARLDAWGDTGLL